ncbi:class F sortase [Bacillus salacetis]|uniref:class F sortase n=1 Tax=Bacillus salacetis TaxID=2315464 RepID=UPI003BA087E3
MKPWLKKTIILYWILLLTTIGATTSAAPPERKVSADPMQPTAIPSFSEKKLNYNPGLSHDYESVEVIPEKIRIPSIGMEAPVKKVGILENGEMEVPDNINEAGWFEPGVMPGGKGNSVLAGHLDGKGKPGAFYHIRDLKKGDTVEISGTEGKTLIFEVLGVESFYTNEAPLERIFGYHSDSRLNLITCSGDFDHNEHEYEERLVVFTQLVKSE